MRVEYEDWDKNMNSYADMYNVWVDRQTFIIIYSNFMTFRYFINCIRLDIVVS